MESDGFTKSIYNIKAYTNNREVDGFESHKCPKKWKRREPYCHTKDRKLRASLGKRKEDEVIESKLDNDIYDYSSPKKLHHDIRKIMAEVNGDVLIDFMFDNEVYEVEVRPVERPHILLVATKR